MDTEKPKKPQSGDNVVNLPGSLQTIRARIAAKIEDEFWGKYCRPLVIDCLPIPPRFGCKDPRAARSAWIARAKEALEAEGVAPVHPEIEAIVAGIAVPRRSRADDLMTTAQVILDALAAVDIIRVEQIDRLQLRYVGPSDGVRVILLPLPTGRLAELLDARCGEAWDNFVGDRLP